jgi:putative MATE family efflux protein
MSNDNAAIVSRIDMLNGPIFKKMLVFALPLIASGILQQSFNSIDIAIVGRFSSSQALAAVGSTGLIVSLFINLFVGISIGANVVIAHYIGQHNERGIVNAIHTVAIVAVVSGLFLLFLGLAIARPLLELIDTPDDVIDLSTLYLRIFFIGMPFMMVYNFGAAILRSMGDTKRPFYSLIVAGIVNTLLNLLLVIVFDMSVAGVAIATVVANMVNAVIMVYLLTHEKGVFKLNLHKLFVSSADLRRILQIGLPAGVQGMVFSISNVFILSTINKLGSDAIAGSAAAINYEYYCYFVLSAFCQAAVAFTSQNYGAGKIDRCKRIFRLSMAMAFVSCAVLDMLIVWQKELFAGIFTTSPEVLDYAVVRLRWVLLFQSLAASYEVAGASLRGLGYSMTPTLFTIFGTCLLRLVWIYTVCPRYNTFDVIMYVYPISWAITGIAVVWAYFVLRRKAFGMIAHHVA